MILLLDNSPTKMLQKKIRTYYFLHDYFYFVRNCVIDKNYINYFIYDPVAYDHNLLLCDMLTLTGLFARWTIMQ